MSLVCTRNNYVEYNGFVYSTLADVAVDTSGSQCQSSYITLPTGWAIAPDNVDSKAVIAAHQWSTNLLVVSSGYAYMSAYSDRMTQLYGSSYLNQTGVQYKVRGCNSQILIMSKFIRVY